MHRTRDPSRSTVVDPRFAYILNDDEMAQGSTLGAPRCTVVLKATGAIADVYCPDAGFNYFGAIQLNYWDRRSGIRLSHYSGEFHIHPERQDHVFELDNGVHVHEQIFAYNSEEEGKLVIPPPAVYYRVHVRNESAARAAFDLYAFAELRGNTERDVVAEYDEDMHGIVAWNGNTPSQIRFYGALEAPDSWETGDDRRKPLSRTWPGKLANAATATGPDPVGGLHFAVDLDPGESRWIDFLCVLSADSREDLKALRARCPQGGEARRRTTEYYWRFLRRSIVRTPDVDVNQGVLWAKANMLRVQTYRPTGWCFTNDPTHSNNAVGRDTAWMSFGADYLNPGFSREALSAFFRLQQTSGKIAEYYDVRNEKTEDYGLNVNDNTPLMVIALWHHYTVTGNKTFLRECYPRAVRAMDYMLSQRNDQGLVWCTATGTYEQGIVGWRNVIENYRISGASTEINSECYAALDALAKTAKLLGKDAAARKYRREAKALRAAINEHLVNPVDNLYYLAIDVDGTPRSDVTADLVFPILFGVAPPERAARIIGALSDAAFWTQAGIRTIPRDDLLYGPTNGFGLLGGVWLAMTYWYAFAAAKYNPSFMAKALAMSFRHFNREPRRNNTVPGQFSEWLHGEILANQGMMLSPWDAPRYLWAAIEGAGGLDVYSGEPRIAPTLPEGWRWMAVTDVPLRGKNIAWLALRMPQGVEVHTTSALTCESRCARYDKDVTDRVRITDPQAAAVAFADEKRTLIFIGNALAQTVTTAASLSALPLPEHTVRLFTTVSNSWWDLGKRKREQIMNGIAVIIDAGGFALIEITPP